MDVPVPGNPELDQARAELQLEVLPLCGRYFTDQSRDLGMAEVLLPPDSDLVGQSVLQVGVRTKYQLSVIGLRRGREALGREGLLEGKLRAGDTLLVIGRWKHIRALQKQKHDFLVPQPPGGRLIQVAPARRRAPRAGHPRDDGHAHGYGLGAKRARRSSSMRVLLGFTRCITLASAYKSIQWPSLLLIVGLMPFSTALQKTGGVDLAAQGLLQVFGDAEPRLLPAALFSFTAITSMFVSNTATALLMAPIALRVAHALDASPYPFVMTVALAASAAFMTPVSSPVNTLVLAPGQYRFGDFDRIGVPLTIVVLLLTVLLVPWLLPLKP